MKLCIKYLGFRICVFVFCFLPSLFCPAQQYSVSEDLRFAQYLIDNNQYHDAIYILKKQAVQNIIPANADSINYYIGWSYYNLKILDSSAFYFSKVNSKPFYQKSAFYNAFDQSYLKKTGDAKNSLSSIRIENDSSLTKLRNLQYAGIALLERDYQQYEDCSKNFSYNYFPLSSEEKNFSDYYFRLKKIKKKSPLLAGVMSAVLPGSGKFYAGYKGQGLAALMTVGVLGISAAESYYRMGYKSPHFITLGSLFTIFYVGNIWGSAVSVKLAREHQLHELDDEILFDMHIPLRRIFN
ncbi:MAG: TM2 domain-containing protein [Bacteroidetes bacterium]|nr:TM2 domain-containing protein [Bacteroidota bacterium]